MVRPSALAVMLLTINSNRVGCSTGRHVSGERGRQEGKGPAGESTEPRAQHAPGTDSARRAERWREDHGDPGAGDEAPGTILQQASAEPPVYLVELVFSFKGVKRVEVPQERIQPM
jgi:hypothetical protein